MSAASQIEPYRPTRLTPVSSAREAAQVLAAWCLLAATDLAATVFGFNRFYRLIASCPTASSAAGSRQQHIAEVVAAVDRARVYYFKRAWCLQSAAAAVCFLRRRGVRAELVIGVRKIPFAAHAWVEVDGAVVMNARPGLQPLYAVITRC